MPDKDLQHFTNNILLESKRLDGFIQRMLEVARLENLSELEQIQPLNLYSLISSVVAQKQIEAGSKDVSLIFEGDADIHIVGNEFILQQVVDNLIGNAIEFSPQQASIKITCQTLDDKALIQVSDEGEGIPDYALERIFDRFYSLPRPLSGKRSSGLGLTFSKRAIELHGGTLTLENINPHGARAVARLPLKSSETH
jgi:two-component system sensor histidine kinase CreC